MNRLQVEAAACARALSIAFLAALTACGGGGGSDEPEDQADAPRECSVAIFGDSIAVDLAAQIKAQRPRYRTEDYSISGSSAEGRLPSVLAWGVTTRLAVIEWGMNDLPFTTADLHAGRIEQMTRHVQKGGGAPILTGISGTVHYFDDRRPGFNSAARDVAMRTNTAHAGWDEVPFTAADMPDGIHPFPEYKARLVARLVEQMDAAAPDCR